MLKSSQHFWFATAAIIAAIAAPSAAYADRANEVRAVTIDDDGAVTRIHVRGADTPMFTAYKLERPSRVVVDLPRAQLADALRGHDSAATFTPTTWAVSTVAAQQLDDGGEMVRVSVTLARPGRYDVKTDGNELVIMVTARDPAPKLASPEALAAAQAQARAADDAASKSKADADAAKQQAAMAQQEAERLRKAAADEAAKADAAQRAIDASKQATAAERAEAARAKADAARAQDEAAKAKQAASAAQATADRARDAAELARAAAVADAAKARAQAAQSQQEAASAKALAAKTREEADSAKRDADAAKSSAARTQAEAQSQVAAAKDQAAAAQAAAARTQASSAAEVAAAHSATANAQAAAANAQAEAAKAKDRADAADRAAIAQRADAERARHEAEAAKAEAAQVRAEADATRSAAAADKKQAELAKTAADQTMRDAKQQLAMLDQKIASAQQLADSARAQQAAAQAREQSARDAEAKANAERVAAQDAAAKAAAARDRASHDAAADRERLAADARAAEDRLARANAATADAERRRAAAESATATASRELDHDKSTLASVADQRTAAEAAARDAAKKKSDAEAAVAVASRQRTDAEAAIAVASKQRTDAEAAAEAAAKQRTDAEAAAREAARRKSDAEVAAQKAAQASQAVVATAKAAPTPSPTELATIRDISFKGDANGGRIDIATIGDAHVELGAVSAQTVELLIDDAALADKLERKLDVSKFGGPVHMVASFRDRKKPNRVRLVAELSSPATPIVTHDAAGIHFQLTADANAPAALTTVATSAHHIHTTDMPAPIVGGFGAASTPIAQQSVSQVAPQGTRRHIYHGKIIDLDFKDAPIHDLLRFIAQTGNISIVVPDTIEARVTVKLNHVPWDQALEVILASHGLWYRREGSIYQIAPRKELDTEDEAEAARRAAMIQAESPRPEVVKLNYVPASELKTKLVSLLSPKGKIEVEDRNNALIVNDVAGNREQVIRLALELDTQTPQISIEARIVEADSDFKRQIGIQWGGQSLNGAASGNATGLTFPSTANILGANDDANNINTGITAAPSNFAVNMPAATGTGEGGAIGLSLGSLAGNLDINLRLSALEDTSTVRIISAPKVTVMNNVQAKISQGVSIPISVVSAAGTQTQFVQADLSLEVTPTVSQRDCAIAMKLNVTKNEPDFSQTGARGDPTILRKEARTQMLVNDGETAVLGGIYTRNTGLQYKKVPWLGDLPVIGWLFKSRSENDDRTEVLVFITPKITNKASLRCQ